MSTPDRLDVARLRAALDRLGDDHRWPDDESAPIFDAVHGDVTAQDSRAAVDSMIRNPRAALTWRLAVEMPPDPAAGRTTGPASRDTATTTVPPLATWLALAATGVAAVGAALQVQHRTIVDSAPIYRTAGTSDVEPRVPDGGRLSREAPVLRWSALDGARYRVRVLTPDLDVLAEADGLPTPEYRVPAEALARVPAGGRLLWQVEAVWPSTRITSRTFEVVVE